MKIIYYLLFFCCLGLLGCSKNKECVCTVTEYENLAIVNTYTTSTEMESEMISPWGGGGYDEDDCYSDTDYILDSNGSYTLDSNGNYLVNTKYDCNIE